MNLEQFKIEAKKRGICGLLDNWNAAKSKKQLMDIALSIQGIQYVAKSTSEGWGLDSDYICAEFAPFLNGCFVFDGDGYNSAVFCQCNDDISVNTTAVLIIDCHGTVCIDRSICELYIVNSDVEIKGNGLGLAYLYNSTVRNNPVAPIVIKESHGTDV